MANIKRKVSHSDFLNCYNYFDRAIRNNRFMTDVESQGARTIAMASFFKIQSNDISDANVLLLQAWMDQFVDAKTASKCYRTLNQKKYLTQNSSRNIQITDKAHATLKSYAEKNLVSLSEAIILLAEASNQSNESLNRTNLNNKQNFELIFEESVRRGDEYIRSLIHSKDQSEIKKANDDEFNDNKGYKEYRDRIKRLTIKKTNETLLEYFEKYFEKPLSYYLSLDNSSLVSQNLLNLRHQLLKDKLLSNEFITMDFAISKTLSLPQFSMSEYGDELIYVLGHIFGCDTAIITSGAKEPIVFTGNATNVQIAYKTFNYLTAFLREEEEMAFKNCHKNMKRKNRYFKAGWHCLTLLHKMLPNDLDDDFNFKLFSETEWDKLSTHSHSKVGLYYGLYQ